MATKLGLSMSMLNFNNNSRLVRPTYHHENLKTGFPSHVKGDIDKKLKKLV
ncbi:MAG TPA: hypothetical protein HA319_04055 [Nitrosopumilaceae archaeon]|nr:hypothetical protein [Nitrosopumilaceae archaeon]